MRYDLPMPASFKVDVQPAVLVWARRTAGYRLDEIAEKLKASEEVVRAWEAGDERPTFVQLRHLARHYHRPVAALLLAEPPDERETVHDFRRPAEVGELRPELRFAIRDARERREVALELQEALDEPLEQFETTARLDDDPEEVGGRLRAALGVELADQQAATSAHGALNLWRTAAERRGVLVFGISRVEIHAARGFSISDRPLPVVGLNSKDAPQGRLFTLAHELTHLALRTGEALCDLSDQEAADPRVETFCNHVAGAALVPRDALMAEEAVRSANARTRWSEADVRGLSRRFSVSREVILRRLLILGRTSKQHYSEWRKLFRQEQQAYRRKLSESEGGPAYITTKVAQLGRLYPRIVLEAHGREAITTSTASQYLGVKVKHFDSLSAETAFRSP
ncbi:MAG: ImmA/IrrE family metallo-endopeptidase [Myxococcota bacterium]